MKHHTKKDRAEPGYGVLVYDRHGDLVPLDMAPPRLICARGHDRKATASGTTLAPEVME